MAGDTTTTRVTRMTVAVLTADWTFRHGGGSRTFPAGKEFLVPGDALLLPGGELRWGDWDVPSGGFELYEDETTWTVTSTTVRRPVG